MCRWFIYLSSEPMLLEDALVIPNNAISKEVSESYIPGLVPRTPDEKTAVIYKDKLRRSILQDVRYNPAGFGVAWYTKSRADFRHSPNKIPRPASYKAIVPLATDRNFLEICANTASNCILAHLRTASLPPVVATNNHPFTFGRHSFMHNGTVAFFPKIKRMLVEIMYKLNSFRFGDDDLDHPLPVEIQGNTDSEHLAMIYLICLFWRAEERGQKKISIRDSFELEDMRQSLLDTIDIVIEVQERVLDPAELLMAASSLNICVADGERLVATRFRSHSKDKPDELPPSLYYSNSAGVVLDRRYPGNPNDSNPLQSEKSWKIQSVPKIHSPHVVIVSDPPTGPNHAGIWKPLPKSHLIASEISTDGKPFVFKIGKIDQLSYGGQQEPIISYDGEHHLSIRSQFAPTVRKSERNGGEP